MKKLFLLPLLCLLTGCLQLEQTINIKQDGSAIVTMVYRVPQQQFSSLQAAQQVISEWQGSTETCNWFFQEQAVRAFFNQPQHGVRLLVYKPYRHQDHQAVEIVVMAKDARRAFELGYFGSISLKDSACTVKLPEGLHQLQPRQLRKLRALCGTMSLSLEIITPRKVTGTNGFKRSSNRVFWKLSADGHGMDIFGKLQNLNVAWEDAQGHAQATRSQAR